jgi:membrane associated rhomboid family serine protease
VSLGVVAETQQGDVAYMAHVGGAVFGALTTKLFAPARREETWTTLAF